MLRFYPGWGGAETASTQRTKSDKTGCQAVYPTQYITTAVACKATHTVIEMLYYGRNVYRISFWHDETWWMEVDCNGWDVRNPKLVHSTTLKRCTSHKLCTSGSTDRQTNRQVVSIIVGTRRRRVDWLTDWLVAPLWLVLLPGFLHSHQRKHGKAGRNYMS